MEATKQIGKKITVAQNTETIIAPNITIIIDENKNIKYLNRG